MRRPGGGEFRLGSDRSIPDLPRVCRISQAQGDRVVAQVLTQVRESKVDPAATSRVDHLSLDQSCPVDVRLLIVDTHAHHDIRDLGRTIIQRHCSQEGSINVRKISKTRLID